VALNETHDVSLRSWVDTANLPDSDFPLQNLPYGVFRRAGSVEPFRAGVGIGDQILDLAAVLKSGGFAKDAAAARLKEALAASVLNDLMAAGPGLWSELRLMLSRALRLGSPRQRSWETCLVAQAQAEFALPARIGDYTDFYTSIHHATAVGRMFRPDNPLLPNYKWMPIGYHGRSSSIGVSGQSFRRPVGQIAPSGTLPPALAPSARLDYELELGVFIGAGNEFGSPIAIDDADSQVFGLCLLNDWSARDLQAWEYQPLGPFLAKNFATTISPWIVTLDALEPYRVPWTRPSDDPPPLPYLDSPQVRIRGGLDIQLEVWLTTDASRRAGATAHRLSRSNASHAYWNIAQMVAHHTINGCNLQPGDLLGTGTQSGPNREEAGSLLELSNGGNQPLTLPNGETRGFLEDGDTVIMRAWCERAGAARVGFGELVGSVRPALVQGAPIDAK
jgi:fumarylacetoacetase